MIDKDESGKLSNVRLAFGGIGTEPWRNEAAEACLTGTTGDKDAIKKAADTLLQDAKGHGQNDFKIVLTRRLLTQIIERACRAQGV